MRKFNRNSNARNTDQYTMAYNLLRYSLDCCIIISTRSYVALQLFVVIKDGDFVLLPRRSVTKNLLPQKQIFLVHGRDPVHCWPWEGFENFNGSKVRFLVGLVLVQHFVGLNQRIPEEFLVDFARKSKKVMVMHGINLRDFFLWLKVLVPKEMWRFCRHFNHPFLKGTHGFIVTMLQRYIWDSVGVGISRIQTFKGITEYDEPGHVREIGCLEAFVSSCFCTSTFRISALDRAQCNSNGRAHDLWDNGDGEAPFLGHHEPQGVVPLSALYHFSRSKFDLRALCLYPFPWIFRARAIWSRMVLFHIDDWRKSRYFFLELWCNLWSPHIFLSRLDNGLLRGHQAWQATCSEKKENNSDRDFHWECSWTSSGSLL